MSERFSPESIEQDIDGLRAPEAKGHDARLTRALASLYAPPAEAGAAIDRVYARVRAEVDGQQGSQSQRGLQSWHRGDEDDGSSPAMMPSTRPARYPPTHHSHAVTGIRTALAALAAVLVVAMITGSFLFAFQSRGRQPGITVRATATAAVAIPGAPPAWQTHTWPEQFIQLQTEFTVSSRDGATAYICDPPVSMIGGVQVPQIWVTHDGGGQWTHTGNLPALGQVAECYVEVDGFNSARLVAMLSGRDVHTGATFDDWFTSSDSGGTWQMVAECLAFPPTFNTCGTDVGTPRVQIQSEALYQGKAYAIYTTDSLFTPSVPTQTHLSVSTDGLHTWHPVDTPILSLTGSKQYVKQYWARVDADGQLDLLADVGAAQPTLTSPPVTSPPEGTDTLWVSHDGGDHWTELAAPPMQGFIVQTSSDGHAWLICGSSTRGGSGGQVAIACSMDSGATWAARPALRTCGSCAETPISTGAWSGANVYLTGDGSVIQVTEYQTQPVLALYRLPPNSSQWQCLGLLPANENALIYAPSPAGGGVLWTYSGGSIGGHDLSGIIGQDLYGNDTSTGVLYTANFAS